MSNPNASALYGVFAGGIGLLEILASIIMTLVGLLILVLAGIPFGASQGWWPTPFS